MSTPHLSLSVVNCSCSDFGFSGFCGVVWFEVGLGFGFGFPWLSICWLHGCLVGGTNSNADRLAWSWYLFVFCCSGVSKLLLRASSGSLSSEAKTNWNADAQMHKCTNAQMHKCTNAQMPKCPNAQMHKCTDANCTNAQMHKCTNAQIAQMHKCTKNAEMLQRTNKCTHPGSNRPSTTRAP